MAFATASSSLISKIGAVNVIKIIRQQKGKVKLVGYNSDIIGQKFEANVCNVTFFYFAIYK